MTSLSHLIRWIFLSILFGVIIAAIVIIIQAVSISQINDRINDNVIARRHDLSFFGDVLYPALMETVLFFLPFQLIARNLKEYYDRKSNKYVLVASIAFIGWATHGANLLSVGQAVGFAILGGLIMYSGMKTNQYVSLSTAAIAHLSWNGTIYLMWMIRGL
jgi:hypothetical protein